MATEVLENALAQALDELDAIKKNNTEQKQLTKMLIEKIEGFDQKLEEQRIVNPSVDMKPVEAMMAKFVAQVEGTIMAQPKSINRRFLLFPEHNAAEYYRIVFGRLLFWMMIFLIATYLFALGKQFIENWTIINEKQLEKRKYESAWEYLYEHETKHGKKKMEDAWQKSK